MIDVSGSHWAATVRAATVGRLLLSCHPKQRAFVADRKRNKLARVPRRGGKSHGHGIDFLVATLMYPDELCIAIASTRGKARELIGQPIERACKQLGYKIHERTIDGQVYLCPEWGGRILLVGCATRKECEKLRGDRAVKIGIDEPEVMRPFLPYLIEEVLEPRLMDFNGQLSLTGTPGPTEAGLFYEADVGGQSGDWSQHHWTILDNDFIPMQRRLRFLEKKREKLGEMSGAYQREYLGRWFNDPTALCFHYDASRNRAWAGEMEAAWAAYDIRRIHGVDVGFNDPMAFSTLGHVHGIPDAYITSSWGKSGLTPTRAAAEVMRIRDSAPGRIVVDSGGIGKGYLEEWRQHHGVACEIATKADKAGSIAEMNGALVSGRLKIVASECQELVDEMAVLQWNEDRDGVKEGQQDHCCDSARYAFRAIGGLRSDPELELSAAEQAAKRAKVEREAAFAAARRKVRRQ